MLLQFTDEWAPVCNCVRYTGKGLVGSVYKCSAGCWWILLVNVSDSETQAETQAEMLGEPYAIFFSHVPSIARIYPIFSFIEFVFMKKKKRFCGYDYK